MYSYGMIVFCGCLVIVATVLRKQLLDHPGGTAGDVSPAIKFIAWKIKAFAAMVVFLLTNAMFMILFFSVLGLADFMLGYIGFFLKFATILLCSTFGACWAFLAVSKPIKSRRSNNSVGSSECAQSSSGSSVSP